MFSFCSAVRFGRIPKREKQRMLLEMQSAMNNMMNNNQLQSQLHSSHTLSIAKALPASTTEPTSEDAGSTPSPCASPHSSQSDSTSGTEPAVSMDTSSSSSSPSALDSNEEEVIGSVTRAHQETFMYNQEQGSLTAQAPLCNARPSNGFRKTNNNHCMQEGQNAWNRHNNLVSVVGNNSPSNMGPQEKEENTPNECPFRLSRSTTASHSPAYIHGAVRAPSTEGCAYRAYSKPVWRVDNRMHLVR